MKRIFAVWLVATVLISAVTACASSSRKLKVGILVKVDTVVLFGRGSLTVVDKVGGRHILRARKVVFEAKGGKIKLKAKLYDGPLAVYPSRGDFINVVFEKGPVRSRPYRGHFIVRLYKGKLVLINVVDMEHYLYSVLGMEINPDWNIEAVKAQAVVARTYALYSMGSYRKAGFDVLGTTRFQVYRGVAAERYSIRKAVDLTRGEILVYRGKPIAAFYHSDSGGATSSSKAVWGRYYPYLVSIKAKFEENSPYHYWQYQIDAKALKRLLMKKYPNIGEIKDIKVLKRDEAGRVMWILVRHTRGSIKIKGSELRGILGYKKIRSTKFWVSFPAGVASSGETKRKKKITFIELLKVKHFSKDELMYFMLHPEARQKAVENYMKEVSGEKGVSFDYGKANVGGNLVSVILFKGKGWGHGVGMSQWGAKAMADHGYNYKEILMYYYPGTRIVKIK